MKRTTVSAPLTSGAAKWITASITTAAALAALLVNARNLGLDPWFRWRDVSLIDYSARRVVVTPPRLTLFAIGDSAGLAATVADGRGAALNGATLRWRSEDTAVVAVDSTGVLVARGPGTTRVIASVRDVSAAAPVTIAQRPARLVIGGDSAVRVPEGQTVTLAAHVLDARGYRIRGVVPRWTAADTTIVRLDSLGSITARGAGETVAVASLDTMSARVAVRVVLVPATINVVSGDSQRAPAGRTLPLPAVVRVLSRGGLPVPEAVVRYARPYADSTLSAYVLTDASGRARTSWPLGRKPGIQRLAITIDGLDTTVTFTAEAEPVRGNTRLDVVRAPMPGRAGAALAERVGVRVADSMGAALAGVPVSWTPLDGGRIGPVAERTDSLGETWISWTMGPSAGTQRARLQVGNPRSLAPLTITTVASAGPPEAVVIVNGRGQRGPVGQRLPQPVVIRLLDKFGNPSKGAAVRANALDGAVSSAVVAADANGRASFAWTLGRATGVQRLELRVEGRKGADTVLATAQAAAPANITLAGGPATGKPSAFVRITAAVTDAYGNPVPDALVSYTATGGTPVPVRVMSDQRGRAVTSWKLGVASGSQSISATIRGTSIKAAHVVRVAGPLAIKR